jgi:hypothetical protein
MGDGRIGTKKSRRRLNKEIVCATTEIDISGVDEASASGSGRHL